MQIIRKVRSSPVALSILTTLFIALAMSCGMMVFYFRTHITYENQIHDSITEVTQLLASSVNGDKHKNLKEPRDEIGEDYKDIYNELNRLKERLSDILYVYTIVMQNGKVYFGVDAAALGDRDKDGMEDHAFLMQEYTEAPIEAKRAFVEGKAITTKDFYSDSWGHFFSAYAPVYDSAGNQVAVLAIDMTVDSYLLRIAEMRQLLFISIVLAILIAVITGLVVLRVLKFAKTTEEQYHVVAESVSDAIVMVDDNGIITYISQAIEAILGYKPEELEGKGLQTIIPKEFRTLYFESISKYLSLSGHDQRQNLELPALKKDESPTFVEVSISEFTQNYKKFYTGVIRDINERKKSELHEKEIMESKMHFLSVVTHELRSPLTVVKESIGILSDGMAGDLNPEQNKFLTIAQKNLSRLARLVNNVLDYQRLETQPTQLLLESVDVCELVSEVCKSLELLGQEKNITLLPQCESGLERVKLDRDRIVQALSNLTDNAIKFTPPGKSIYVGVKKENDHIKFFVKDEGVGIKQKDLSKLFLVFSQLPQSKKVKAPGSGLGLSIVKKIIELHKGEVGVESKEGLGSEFYFTLPVNF